MSEQSTAKFLVSREGRPVLIGTLIAMTVFIVIGFYTWNLLFPDDPRRQQLSEEQQEQQRENAGRTSVSASSGNVRADLTSEDLSPEARGAVDEFNRQAESEGRLPTPTADNVEMVRVEPELPENANANGSGGMNENGTGQSGADNLQPERMTTEQRRDARDQERAQSSNRNKLTSVQSEYRARRFEAATALVSMYGAPPQSASVRFDSASGEERDKPLRVGRNEDGTAGLRQGTGENAGGSGQCKAPLVKGGDIRYAKTDIALNTDYLGPVHMTFLDGNLRGWTGMGSFELNEFGAMMKLRIQRLIDPDGQTYEVSAWVLDPETTLWAMRSDVDRHIIYRYGGFGLGVVLSSFAKIAENRSQLSQIVTPDGTTATANRDPDGKQITFTVLGEFGRLFEEIFRDSINRPITVTLDPEEEAGILFENTVCEKDTQITRDRKKREERAAQGFADPLL